MNPTISLYLDKRRTKGNGKYPVKLRIYHDTKAKNYRTGIDAAEEEFFNAYQSKKPRKEYTELKIKLQAIENKANESVNELDIFSFEKFEKKQYGNKGDSLNVCACYGNYIEKLKEQERFGTASSYELSLKSILSFRKSKRARNEDYIAFNEITPDYLTQYEKWMKQTGRGMTTIGIYLRPLRAMFNMALNEGDITMDIYPFGKHKYQIPAGSKVKKALSKEDLKALYEYDLSMDKVQAKARDFWFFSYQCNGMNIKDILGLRYEDIQGDVIVFTRAKTRNTTKTHLKPIMVPVTDYVKQIIQKYGNEDTSKGNYIFPIYYKGISEIEKFKKAGHFAKYINLHIKKIAKAAGVTTDISTYWARHSFTTNAIRSGASMEFIQESLGHQDLKTTMNYWGGFEESVKRDISEKIMDFS